MSITQFSRRRFIQLSSAGAGVLMLPRWARATGASAANPFTDRFFLQVFLQGGADSSYLFDARPLAMTKAGIIQNYNSAENIPYQGKKGGTCLRSPLTEPLMAYKDYFSVLNGVWMSTEFQGHPQTVNFAFTGDGLGGPCFLPDLAQANAEATAIDTVQNGTLNGATMTNTQAMVPLDPQAMGSLNGKLTQLPDLNTSTELGGYVRKRLSANAPREEVCFSEASKQMLAGFDQTASLKKKLLAINPPSSQPSIRKPNLSSSWVKLFQNRVARTALWVYQGVYDTHGFDQATAQPKLFSKTVGQLARIFKALKETPYDPKRSLLDVTTVMVATEFNRTLRQTNQPFNKTGTDHNPLGNSILIGGAGVKGGQVFGATDYVAAGETLSPVHLQFDRTSVQLLGRPFDFQTMKSRTDLPSTYAVTDYLNVASVINTVYSLFGVKPEKFRQIDRIGTVAPQLGRGYSLNVSSLSDGLLTWPPHDVFSTLEAIVASPWKQNGFPFSRHLAHEQSGLFADLLDTSGRLSEPD